MEWQESGVGLMPIRDDVGQSLIRKHRKRGGALAMSEYGIASALGQPSPAQRLEDDHESPMQLQEMDLTSDADKGVSEYAPAVGSSTEALPKSGNEAPDESWAPMPQTSGYGEKGQPDNKHDGAEV